jgi:hypothetical protein
LSQFSGFSPICDTLDGLTGRLDRLRLCHRDPEQFYIERSELVYALKRIKNDLARIGREYSEVQKIASSPVSSRGERWVRP